MQKIYHSFSKYHHTEFLPARHQEAGMVHFDLQWHRKQ